MAQWLDAQTLEQCKQQIRGGLTARSALMREIADALVEDQLSIVPAVADIITNREHGGGECDLIATLRDRLRDNAPRLRFDPEKAELIIAIQMRIVPRLLRTLDALLAGKGL